MAIVLLPGEVFADLGLAIKRGSPFRHTLVVELANDNPAYIPTEKAFKEGSYETVNSRIAPGGGERLAEAAIQLLKESGGTVVRGPASSARRSAYRGPGSGLARPRIGFEVRR